MAKLYQTNFDLFVNNKLRVDLDEMGYKWLDGCAVQAQPDGRKLVTLPVPSAFLMDTTPE